MYDKRDVEVLASDTVFQGYNRIDRVRLRHRLFTGQMGAEIVREVVDRGHAVAVLPYDAKRDEVVLIEQFRIGPYARKDNPWQLEIVAGIIEPGEGAIDVAHRETKEEAGLQILELAHVCDCYTSPGVMTEHIAVYCGRVDAFGAGGIHGVAEEGEDIRVVVLNFEDAMVELTAGRIKASPAVIALLWLALHREELRRQWG